MLPLTLLTLQTMFRRDYKSEVLPHYSNDRREVLELRVWCGYIVQGVAIYFSHSGGAGRQEPRRARETKAQAKAQARPCGCARGSVSVRSLRHIGRETEPAVSTQQGPGEVPSRAGEGEAERRSVAEPFF